MKLYINKWAVSLLCVALAAVAWAANPQEATQAANAISTPTTQAAAPAKDYAACFAAWDNNMHTLQTQFIQTTEYDGMQILRSTGQIFYEQNGPKLRLDTFEDGQVSQSALTNKKQIYILDDKGKEISKVSWNEWLEGQPNQALFDFGNYTALLKRHQVSVSEVLTDRVVLRLVPTTKTADYILYVTINKSDCFPQAITVQADLMKNTAQLADIKLNTKLNPTTFKGLK